MFFPSPDPLADASTARAAYRGEYSSTRMWELAREGRRCGNTGSLKTPHPSLTGSFSDTEVDEEVTALLLLLLLLAEARALLVVLLLLASRVLT